MQKLLISDLLIEPSSARAEIIRRCAILHNRRSGHSHCFGSAGVPSLLAYLGQDVMPST